MGGKRRNPRQKPLGMSYSKDCRAPAPEKGAISTAATRYTQFFAISHRCEDEGMDNVRCQRCQRWHWWVPASANDDQKG